jgi:hypothetical protein
MATDLAFLTRFHCPEHHEVRYVRRRADLARRKPGVQIPSPPPPYPQVRAPSAWSGRRSLHVAAASRPQPQGVVQLGRASSDRLRHRGPDTMTTERSHYLAAHLARHRRAILARIRLLGRHEVDLATAQSPPTTTQVQADASAGPAVLRQPRSPDSDSGRRQAGRGHGGRLRRSRPSSHAAACPTAALHDLTPVGHNGHWNPRTLDAHAG